MNLKEIWKRLRGIILFGIIYLAAFFFMEMREVPVHIIHTRFDELIPFCKYFIVPYTLWYFYVCATVLYLGLNTKKLKEYNQLIYSMILGMIIFILTSLIYPNGQDLRPVITSSDIFSRAVNFLYTVDTPTNILPSLHVYVSVACAVALMHDRDVRNHRWIRFGVCTLTVLICLSTMFLKQHSVVDVIAAFVCNAAAYLFVYQKEHIMEKISSQNQRKNKICKTRFD